MTVSMFFRDSLALTMSKMPPERGEPLGGLGEPLPQLRERGLGV